MRLTEPTASTRALLRKREAKHAEMRRELRAKGLRPRRKLHSKAAEAGASRAGV